MCMYTTHNHTITLSLIQQTNHKLTFDFRLIYKLSKIATTTIKTEIIMRYTKASYRIHIPKRWNDEMSVNVLVSEWTSKQNLPTKIRLSNMWVFLTIIWCFSIGNTITIPVWQYHTYWKNCHALHLVWSST